MSPDDALKQVSIPTPCPADWRRMEGGWRSRRCSACNKSVVNFAALSDEEAASLVESSGGELCARITRRGDGSILTRPTRFGIRTLMTWVAWAAAVFGVIRFFGGSGGSSRAVAGVIAVKGPPPAATAPNGARPGNPPVSCPE